MPMRANTPGTTPAKMEKPSNLISTVTSAPTASAMSRFSMEVCLTPPRRKRQSGDAVRGATRYRCQPRGPLSKLVDETDSKSVAAYPASRFESGEGHGTFHCRDGELCWHCSKDCSKLTRRACSDNVELYHLATDNFPLERRVALEDFGRRLVRDAA